MHLSLSAPVAAPTSTVPEFEPTVLQRNLIRLLCRTDGIIDGSVIALVNGITIGSFAVSRIFEPGEVLDLPVTYFPNVGLPAKIRFVSGDTEICTPFQISTHEDVMTLLGHGEVSVKNLFLDGGLLRGTIVNSANSLHVPSTYIKINGTVIRSAVVEPPRLRHEGGSVTQFAVPVRTADFTESGLLIDLHIAGIDYPVASYSYVRADRAEETSRVIELDEKLRQLQKSTFLQVEMLRDSLEQRLVLQQERIDSFVEYAMSLLLDHMAGPGTGGDAAAALQTLRGLGGRAAAARAGGVPAAARSARLPLESGGFAFGWYEVESNERGPFRWMGQTGLVRNPHAARPVRRVEIAVSQVYGAHEPMVRATLNDQDLVATLERHGQSFVLIFSAPMEGAVTGESLHLESFASGCPATDHGVLDHRTLSLAITDIAFFYEAEPEPAAPAADPAEPG